LDADIFLRDLQSGPDFIITAHALDRMYERWPLLVEGFTDEEVGHLVLEEVTACIEAGRIGAVAPRSLAPIGRYRWTVQEKNTSVVWTATKMRGYVLRDDKEGTLVLTVLKSRDLDR
jgi:hypothetical protein